MDKKFAVSLVVNNVPGVMNRIGGISVPFPAVKQKTRDIHVLL